jgi:HK97 gp10 family phage protein
MTLLYIKGLSEMEKVLFQLPQELSKKILINSLKKSAIPILEDARNRVPLGKESKGRIRLRRNKSGNVSIKNYGKLKLELKIVNVKDTIHSATVAVTIGRAFWGMFLELGTKHISKKPFMRPAFESKKEKALSLLAGMIKLEIEKAAKRIVRKRAKNVYS